MFRDAVPRTSSSSAQMQSSLAAVLLHGEKGAELTRKCDVAGCSGKHNANGLCLVHYQRMRRYGRLHTERRPSKAANRINSDGSRKICVVVGCDRATKNRDYCEPHHKELRAVNDSEWSVYDECPTSGCGRTKLKNREICSRCTQLMWRYSLTVPRLLKMHSESERECNNPGCRSRDDLHVDHDHSCCPPGKYGKGHKKSCGECVRGWLCSSCNKSLGALQENPRRIQGLLDYLQTHKSP